MAGKNIFPVPEIPLKALKRFAGEKLPFVIVGGVAIALHGIPRSTIDIDIVMPAEAEAAGKLFSVMRHAGLLSRDRYIFTLIDKPHLLIGQWMTLQDKSGMEIIDIFFESEKEFTGLLKHAKKIKMARLNFYVASLDDLERMKRMSARAIDMADIALIEEKKGSKDK
ncbi:MAG: hypothetical protein Q8O12_03430 [Candidatus Omnitrophota bacterium]|nr:hypothetical protein [Candidatus Omnitrophota bacterium]